MEEEDKQEEQQRRNPFSSNQMPLFPFLRPVALVHSVSSFTLIISSSGPLSFPIQSPDVPRLLFSVYLVCSFHLHTCVQFPSSGPGCIYQTSFTKTVTQRLNGLAFLNFCVPWFCLPAQFQPLTVFWFLLSVTPAWHVCVCATHGVSECILWHLPTNN